jgi:hypothetical protein
MNRIILSKDINLRFSKMIIDNNLLRHLHRKIKLILKANTMMEIDFKVL